MPGKPKRISRTCTDCGRIDVVIARQASQRCRACSYVAMRTLKHCERCEKELVGKHRLRKRFCSNTCSAYSRAPRPSPLRGTKTGRPSWNAGLKGYRSGYRHRLETIQKIKDSLSGDRAPNWKGGVSTADERERRSAAYRAWRKAVFNRDDYTCQFCGDRAAKGHPVVLNADHIKPFALHPELRLDVSNGRTLCAPCHRATPTYGNGTRRQTFAQVAEERISALQGASPAPQPEPA